MNITQQAIILSADQNDNNHERNRQLHQNLLGCLSDCNFKFREATGVYKGKEEASVVVIVKDETDIETVKDFAFKSFNQESVLYQDANQEACLLYADGTTKQLGRLQQVLDTTDLDSYTIMNGITYATVKR